jgi:hypothetical protein
MRQSSGGASIAFSDSANPANAQNRRQAHNNARRLNRSRKSSARGEITEAEHNVAGAIADHAVAALAE